MYLFSLFSLQIDSCLKHLSVCRRIMLFRVFQPVVVEKFRFNSTDIILNAHISYDVFEKVI